MSKKIELNQICKGKNIQPVILDPNDPEVIKLIKEIKEEQERILDLKNIPEEIYNLRVTI